MTDTAASTRRDWHFGDEPCTYREGCSLPLRTHTHLNPGPGQPVRIVYYDEQEAARRYCPDFWQQWGIPERCCQSCHEDRDMGYEMMDPPDGSSGEVCCWVVHEWERQTANAE